MNHTQARSGTTSHRSQEEYEYRMTTLDLTTLTLAVGSHNADSSEMCLLEAAAYQAGEAWSDHPRCVSPVLAAYGRGLNDVLPDDTRQRLVSFIPRLLNTAGDGLDEQRSYLALDWLTRTHLPAWLRLVPALTAQADLLAASSEVVDLDTASAVGVLVREAAAQAGAAEGAAWDAAWAASWPAAGEAAAWPERAAVRAAAGDAAGAAAGAASWASWDAARAATEAAAEAAVRDALAPTVTALQDSAIDLFDRMLSVKK